MKGWALGSIWIVIGIAAGVFVSRLASSSATPASSPTRATALLTDRHSRPSGEQRPSFRELLFQQNGRPTVEASLRLYGHLRDASSAERAVALDELQAGRDAIYDPLLRCLAFVLSEHLREVAPNQLPEFRNPDGSQRGEDRREDLLRQLSQRDPAAAFALAQMEPFPMLRPLMMAAALKGAAITDPDHAFQLWDSVVDPDLKHRLSKAIAWSFAKDAPERIDDWLDAFPLRRTTVLEAALEAWARKDPAAATAYLEKEGRPLSQDSPSTGGFLRGWGETDPKAAATWAEPLGLTLPASAIAHWAESDPAAALQHAARATTLAKRLELLGQGAATWLGRDPAAAWDWMDSNLSEAARFQAIRTHLRQLPQPDEWSKRAAAWLADYPHPDSLKDTARFLRSWANSDAVEAWFSTLPPTTRRRLQEATGRSPTN